MLRPAEDLAREGFPLDRALVGAIRGNEDKLGRFPASAELFLPGGEVPAVEQVLRNPDLARTYRQIGERGWRWFYTGQWNSAPPRISGPYRCTMNAILTRLPSPISLE